MKIVVFFSFCLFHFRFYYFLYFFCTWDCCETRAKTLTKSMKHLRDVCAGVCKMMTSLNLMTLDWSCSILKHTHSPAWYYSYFSTFFYHRLVLSVCSVCVCVCVLAGKGKVKVKGIRTLRGGNDPVTASAVEQRMNPLDSTLPSAGVRSLGGSAPGTPTEAEAVINQSATTGSWSRNSLRGSKCNSNSSTLSKPLLIFTVDLFHHIYLCHFFYYHSHSTCRLHFFLLRSKGHWLEVVDASIL